MFSVGNRNRSDEAIAAARHCFNKTRIARAVPERVPHLQYDDAKTFIKIDEGVTRPEALLDFFTRNDAAMPFQQQQKEAEGLVLEMNPDSISRERTRYPLQ